MSVDMTSYKPRLTEEELRVKLFNSKVAAYRKMVADDIAQEDTENDIPRGDSFISLWNKGTKKQAEGTPWTDVTMEALELVGVESGEITA